MDDHIDPQDSGTVERLRALGRRPVDPATASAHLTAMAAASPRRSPWRTKAALAGAFLAGLLLGGTGLATAGALPEPAQAVAYNVLHPMGLNVPHPHAGNPCKGPPVWARERREPTAEEQAEHERVRREECPQRGEGRQGPPAHAGRGGPEGTPGRGRGQEGGPERRPHAGDPCRGRPDFAGPPPWAGRDTDPSEAEVRAHQEARKALQEAWRAQCGRGPGGDASHVPGTSPPQDR